MTPEDLAGKYLELLTSCEGGERERLMDRIERLLGFGPASTGEARRVAGGTVHAAGGVTVRYEDGTEEYQPPARDSERKVRLPVIREPRSRRAPAEPRTYASPVQDAVLTVLRDAPGSLSRAEILLEVHKRFPQLAGDEGIDAISVSKTLSRAYKARYRGLHRNGNKSTVRWMLDLDAPVTEPPSENGHNHAADLEEALA